MARINVEDSLFKDARFIDLILALGSRRMALGAMTECFIVAQKHWLKFKGIPIEEWRKEKLADEIISVGLASVKENLVYVHGSEDQFRWIEQRSEAGRHKKRKNQYSEDNAKKVERPLTARNGSEPLSLSLSLSPSLKKKETTSCTVVKKTSPQVPVEITNHEFLFEQLPLNTKERWNQLYSDTEFVRRELIKAFGYYQDNPRKTPKTISGWSRAISSWLERGWPKYVKNIPSQNQNSSTMRIVKD